ncbi:MAG: TfoX/Sxy family protein [Ruminococcus sp.]|nr:TfoX/Sxy family protein [Ruminococcus sp.]
MASSKDYLNYVLEQLSPLEDISYRAMMGEYVLYYQGKVFGGIYDDRLLIKPTKSAVEMIGEPEYQLPYEGGKEMLLADVDDRELLCRIVDAMVDELPAPKKRRK